jgi:hypothetical protein
MRTGLIDISPQSGQAGEHTIYVQLIESNDNLDVSYVFDAFCGNKSARTTVNVAGKYEVLEASDGPLTDSSGSELWVLKQ